MKKRLLFVSINFGACLYAKLNYDKKKIIAFNDLNENIKKNILQKETDIFIWGNGYINNTSKYINYHPHRIKKFVMYSYLQNYLTNLSKKNDNEDIMRIAKDFVARGNDQENSKNVDFNNLLQFYNKELFLELNQEDPKNRFDFIDLAFNEYLCAAIDKKNNLYVWREPTLNAEKEKTINNHARIGIERLGSNHKVIEAKFTKDKLFFLNSKGEVYFYKIDIYQPRSDDFFESSLPETQVQIHKDKLIHIKEFKNIKMLATGKDHILALDKDGIVYGMGDDSFGQLGLGTFTEEREQHMKVYNNFIERRERLPKKIDFPEKIKKIVCGENHSLALSNDGNVYGFGFNRFLQLSNDPIYRQKIIGLNKPTLITQDKFRNLKVLDIAASKNCSFFMVKENDGTYHFFSAGEGLRGQLGQNIIKHMSDVEEMPDISGLVNSETLKPFEPMKLTCGTNHCLLLFKNPRLIYVWGNNEYGELGTKDRVYYESPIPILEEYSLPFRILNISAAYKNSAFICEKVDPVKKKEILEKDRLNYEAEMQKKKKKKKKNIDGEKEEDSLEVMKKSFLRSKIDDVYHEIKKYL